MSLQPKYITGLERLSEEELCELLLVIQGLHAGAVGGDGRHLADRDRARFWHDVVSRGHRTRLSIFRGDPEGPEWYFGTGDYTALANRVDGRELLSYNSR